MFSIYFFLSDQRLKILKFSSIENIPTLCNRTILCLKNERFRLLSEQVLQRLFGKWFCIGPYKMCSI